MMSEFLRRSDWDLLGLEPGASPAEVHEAYETRRRLYASQSLATYALLTDSERAAHLDRLRNAMERITKTGMMAEQSPPAPVSQPVTQDPPPLLEDCPDLADNPGGYLRHHRRARAATLEEIAKETRISRGHLANLETERFDALPAAVYVRGFVTQYARALNLSEHEALATRFVERLEESQSEE